MFYWGSQGIKRNLAAAAEYYRMSASTGDPVALYDYGIIQLKVFCFMLISIFILYDVLTSVWLITSQSASLCHCLCIFVSAFLYVVSTIVVVSWIHEDDELCLVLRYRVWSIV